jgi:hypothetical protein
VDHQFLGRQIKGIFVEDLYPGLSFVDPGEPAVLVADKMDGAYVGQNNGIRIGVDDGIGGEVEVCGTQLSEMVGFVLRKAITLWRAQA